jgi:ribosome assembly protein 1
MAHPKYSSKRGLVTGSSAQGLVKFSIRAAPLPKPLLEFILDNSSILKKLQRERRNAPGDSADGHDQDGGGDDADQEGSYDDSGETFRTPTVRPDRFWTALEEICKRVGGDWDKGVVDRIWAFGPHKAGGCLLIDARKKNKIPNSYALPFFRLFVLTLLTCIRLRRRLDRTNAVEASLEALNTNENGVAEGESGHDFDHHVETGFQLATFQGPLCSEPVEGMAYFLESLEVASDETKSETGGTQPSVPSILVNCN